MNYNWATTEWPEVNSKAGSEVRLSFFKKPCLERQVGRGTNLVRM